MIAIFSLDLSANAQIITITGGRSGSVNAFLQFATAPSAGTVSIEYLRSGSTSWAFLQNCNAASITSGILTGRIDGGIASLRVTFSGLVGGTLPVLAVVDNDTAAPSSDLLTDGGFGQSRRIRVDPGQTGFFAGKFFRSYLESLIPVVGPSVQVRFTTPIDFILWSQQLTLDQGALELRLYTGATTSGSWTTLPSIGVNRMIQRPQPYYASQIVVETGGNFSGGTEVDVLKVRTASSNTVAANVGQYFSERGLPAGVYHGRFQTLAGGITVNDSAQFIYAIEWEERP